MQEISAQASVYVPMTNSPSTLPSYITMDSSSPWYTSALQATAFESMTLPARLRAQAGGRTTLANMEVSFNNHGHGNRKIAHLGMSVADPRHLAERGGIHDSQDVYVGFLPSSPQGPQRLGSTVHLFGSTEALRGPWRQAQGVEQPHIETRELFESGPTIHRSVLLCGLSIQIHSA